MKEIAAGLASLGRGPDTMLVHMAPEEVAGLQKLALAHGGSLTTNPQTGLPEAGFLKNILPALAAAAAVYFTGGAAAPAVAGSAGAAGAAGAGGLFGLGSAGTGALAGGLTGALTNKQNPLMGALMGGLGGYGIGGGMGAAMQSGMFGGAEAAGANLGAGITGGMPPVPGNAFLQSGTNTALDTAASQLLGGNQLANPAMFPEMAGSAFTPNAAQMSMAPEAIASRPSFMQALGQQFPSNTSKLAGIAGITGALGGFDQPQSGFAIPEQAPSNYRKQVANRRPYDPTAPDGYFFTDRGIVQPNYGYAEGGSIDMKDGGFVVPADVVSHLGNGDTDAGLRKLMQKTGAAPIKGEGDGMGDRIRASINGSQPALVAAGEAYIDRPQVARIGGGDQQRGAKKLYAMMDKVRQARTGSTKQGRQINPDRFIPA